MPDSELLADVLERSQENAAVAEALLVGVNLCLRGQLALFLETLDEAIFVGAIETNDTVKGDVLGAEKTSEIVQVLNATEVFVDDETADRLIARLSSDAFVEHLTESVKNRF